MTQLRKGLWAFCILKIVEAEPCYGYDIVRRLSEVKGLVVTEGTVYPILARFKRLRLARTSPQKLVVGPPRKYYQITGRGQEQPAKLNHFWKLVRDGVDAVGSGKRK